MKKGLLSILMSAFLFAGTGIPAMANNSNASIGVIDSVEVIKHSSLYSELQKAESELKRLQKDYETNYMERVKKLQNALKQKKSPEELKKLHQQYEKELLSKQKHARQIMEQKSKQIQSLRDQLQKRVTGLVQSIAKQKNLTYVVEKKEIYVGGTDITQDVINKL